jgi:CDP-glycerol glycerophosphotransferase (TagB/SpsB family)
LGIDWQFPYNVDFKIPLTKNEVSNLTIKIIYDDDNHHIAMDNHIELREFAGLSSLGNYLIKNGRIISFRGRTFHIQPYSYSSVLKLEFKALVRILKSGGPFLFQGIFYRIVYVLLYPFWKNRTIWLFIDRDIIADDNAEHLFKYCIEKKDDGIEKYFIINRDSPDYERLNSSLDNVVAFGSFKHRIKYLFSEKIMISQVTRGILNPFTHENSYIYEGLSTYKFCFLQHGVTKDNISSWIKKYHKNLYMFLTVSDLERDSMINGGYNFEAERIPALGFPRYDNLKNDPQREILFIPTWRRKLDNPAKILNSDFLKSINSFLSNERLIKKADELGYKIVFRPHPELWKFLDFINLENATLSEGPYQEMFKTASVMITDYSSVAFDFAYLKKPVIYYQDGKYHYGEGYYDYETMGFGKVVEDEDELIDKVIEYMENDCKMEDEYADRVDSFFKYTDRNNCKRVYEWLLEH